MNIRGLGRVYQPTRQCRRCAGDGCERCDNGRRPIAVWHVQFSHQGRQFRESSGTKNRSQAVKYLKKRVAEVAGAPPATVGKPVERTSFEDLAEMLRQDYRLRQRKSTRRMEIALARLGEFFSGMLARDISTDIITRYINMRLAVGVARATVRNEVNALRRAFHLAEQAGRVTGTPHFPSITVGPPRKGFFEEAMFRKVVAALPEALRPIAEFAYLSGWRKGEILTLRWSQVDMKAGVIRLDVGSTKNSDGRVLPFKSFPALVELMERRLAVTREVGMREQCVVPFVFHRNGKAIKSIDKAWRRACKTAGCPGMLFHDLRRTAVRNFERAGIPRSVAMRISGHRTEAIYRRYAIVSERDIEDGLGRLASFLGDERAATR